MSHRLLAAAHRQGHCRQAFQVIYLPSRQGRPRFQLRRSRRPRPRRSARRRRIGRCRPGAGGRRRSTGGAAQSRGAPAPPEGALKARAADSHPRRSLSPRELAGAAASALQSRAARPSRRIAERAQEGGTTTRLAGSTPTRAKRGRAHRRSHHPKGNRRRGRGAAVRRAPPHRPRLQRGEATRQRGKWAQKRHGGGACFQFWAGLFQKGADLLCRFHGL
jgi:hypothetical protein